MISSLICAKNAGYLFFLQYLHFHILHESPKKVVYYLDIGHVCHFTQNSLIPWIASKSVIVYVHTKAN